MTDAQIIKEIEAIAALLRGSPPTPHPPAPRLDLLCQCFGLKEFERSLILLCAGMELEPNWGSLCASALQDNQKNYPCFQVAIAAFPQPQWSALAPHAPLRYWKLIELGGGNALTNSPIRLDERILHFLLGTEHLDERLAILLEPIVSEVLLAPSHAQLCQEICAPYRQITATLPPILQLCGADAITRRMIALQISRQLGLRLYHINSKAFGSDHQQIHLIQRLCEREYILSGLMLLIEEETTEDPQHHLFRQLLERIACPLILSRSDRYPPRHRPILTFDINHPSAQEQHHVWEQLLPEPHHPLIEQFVSYFNLSTTTIHTISQQLDPEAPHASLWQACRRHARPQLDELAQRIESQMNWSDLVLPAKELAILKDIAAHVRQRLKVYEVWGMGSKNQRGLGISALFAGASGTGKTLSAEVLGKELNLDVYRIDLSAVVSKYIGETEKNLRKIFDAAEAGGVILLFDEADALFGKRSEVKDSHDRHANIEVSYLLQKMESYRGLAILTTNLKSSLDQAFLRRLRFVIQFPFPDASQREEIWRRVFPPTTPTHALDYAKLARLNIAGGNIRNMALNAAFMAADQNEPIQMKHILQSARVEYMKMERPMTDTELKALQ